jgi:hypothetical protein
MIPEILIDIAAQQYTLSEDIVLTHHSTLEATQIGTT